MSELLILEPGRNLIVPIIFLLSNKMPRAEAAVGARNCVGTLVRAPILIRDGHGSAEHAARRVIAISQGWHGHSINACLQTGSCAAQMT